MTVLVPLGMTPGLTVQEQEQRERWARGQVELEKQKRSSAALLAAQGPTALLFVRSPLTQTEAATADGWLAILRCAACISSPSGEVTAWPLMKKKGILACKGL